MDFEVAEDEKPGTNATSTKPTNSAGACTQQRTIVSFNETEGEAAAESVGKAAAQAGSRGGKLAAKVISLETFNPLDPRKRLNSPLSIRICKMNGILPSKLFHCSYKEIKGI